MCARRGVRSLQQYAHTRREDHYVDGGECDVRHRGGRLVATESVGRDRDEPDAEQDRYEHGPYLTSVRALLRSHRETAFAAQYGQDRRQNVYPETRGHHRERRVRVAPFPGDGDGHHPCKEVRAPKDDEFFR